MVCVQAKMVSKEVRKCLKEGDVAELNHSKLQLPQSKRQKLSSITVPVVYVYELQGAKFTAIEEAPDHQGKLQGVYSIPIGGKIESGSKR